MSVEVWLSLPTGPPSDLAALVRELDDTALTGVAVSDHVCVPIELTSRYPYTGRRAVLPSDTEFADPLTFITALGGASPRLRFMTHVLLAPLWHPVMLARQVATSVALLGPRVELGVGVGWMREEYDALKVPFERRGTRLDETIPLLRRLWSGDVVEHAGVHHRFAPLTVHPKPSRPVPVLVGGHSDAALRRAARLGDGWVGVNPTLDELETIVRRLRDNRATAGLPLDGFTVRSGVKGPLTDERVEALVRLCIDGVIIFPWQLPVPYESGRPVAVAAGIADVVTRLRAVTAALVA